MALIWVLKTKIPSIGHRECATDLTELLKDIGERTWNDTTICIPFGSTRDGKSFTRSSLESFAKRTIEACERRPSNYLPIGKDRAIVTGDHTELK